MPSEKLKKLEKGDKILFNDRKQPLEVEKVEKDRFLVKGSGGGEYEIYEAEDTDDLLFCSRGQRRYSSYCRNLRKVGEWIKNGKSWRHSKTGKEVSIAKNEVGYWTVESDDFEVEKHLDLPMYGYNDREEAVKDIEKLIGDRPEGN